MKKLRGEKEAMNMDLRCKQHAMWLKVGVNSFENVLWYSFNNLCYINYECVVLLNGSCIRYYESKVIVS